MSVFYLVFLLYCVFIFFYFLNLFCLYWLHTCEINYIYTSRNADSCSRWFYILVSVTGWLIVKRLFNGICNARLLQRPNLQRMIHSAWHYIRTSDVNILTINHLTLNTLQTQWNSLTCPWQFQGMQHTFCLHIRQTRDCCNSLNKCENGTEFLFNTIM